MGEGEIRIFDAGFNPIIPEAAQPKPEWGEQFGRDSGFSLEILEWTASIFVDRRITQGNIQERLEILNQGHGKPIAHILFCEGRSWHVDSELTSPDRAGIILYTDSGKALATGQVDLAPQNQNVLKFKLNSLYAGITNRMKIDAECDGGIDANGWYVGCRGRVSGSK